MATVPKPLHKRVAHDIKETIHKTRLHSRQIAALQSGQGVVQAQIAGVSAQVAAMQPGAWALISLQAGWANLGGYIPAQVRILQNGMSQVIGHIHGGTITDGTLIGTLAGGFFNTAHAHKFTGNATTGAGAVAHPGTGNVGDSLVLASPLLSTQIPTSDHTVNVTGSGSGHIVLGPSGTTFQNIPGGQFTGTTTIHNTATAGTTNVNKNTPVILLSTSGQLTVMNFDPNVTELSFSELIPLITA